MKKIISQKTLAMCVAAAAFFVLPLSASAADKLVVKDVAGVTNFLVTDKGRVGIGVTAPEYPMHIASGGVAITQLRFTKDKTLAGGGLTSIADNNFMVHSGAFYNPVGGWKQASADGKSIIAATGATGYVIYAQSGSVVGATPTLVSRLRITYDGKVGLGVNSPIYPLQLAGGAYSDGFTWATASSRELKENIKQVSAKDAFAALEELEPVQYNYKDIKDENRVGFIAEDVPEIVATHSRNSVDGLEVTAVLTKVVQEQQKMIEELRDKMAQLETELQFKKDKDLTVSLLR